MESLKYELHITKIDLVLTPNLSVYISHLQNDKCICANSFFLLVQALIPPLTINFVLNGADPLNLKEQGLVVSFQNDSIDIG